MQPRSTILFGNGIGMALNPEYFCLSAGLENAWNSSSSFTSYHKQLVTSAISGASEKGYPKSEDQLDKLQMALVALKFLNSFEKENSAEWLNGKSRDLPHAFQTFIHAAAVYFHDSDEALPKEFIENLARFINDSKSHVAVLNYDNLLYDALTKIEILKGYSGALIDGFHRDGFRSSNLDRHDSYKLGWYLHLHGSPLYIDNKKIMRNGRDQLDPTHASHIVLTHVKHKPSIVNASPILSEYWKRFDSALDESEKIILFGYAGNDNHLNNRVVLGAGAVRKPVHIIEWGGADDVEKRGTFWNTKLSGCNVTVHHLQNILEFADWGQAFI